MKRLFSPLLDLCSDIFRNPSRPGPSRPETAPLDLPPSPSPAERTQGPLTATTTSDGSTSPGELASLRALNRLLATLVTAHATLIRAATERDLVRNICSTLTDGGAFELAWIGSLQNDRDDSLTLRALATSAALAPTDIDTASWWKVMPERELALDAARRDKTQIIRSLEADSPAADLLTGRLNSCAFLPLRPDGHATMLLGLYARDASNFAPYEISLLESFAADLSAGIDSCRARSAYELAIVRQESQVRRLRRSMELTIEAISSTLEARDPYTAGHQRRVAEIATAIAAQMGLDPFRVDGIRLAALVHDIGKILVPIQILCNPGRLTKFEFDLIKTHPAEGYAILKDLDLPWPIADMVRQHHEYLDGSGYPQGLSGDEILLDSRILTVADIVESMSSARPYRPALGIDAALQEIQRLRGHKLDTQVVQACLKHFAETTAPDFDHALAEGLPQAG